MNASLTLAGWTGRCATRLLCTVVLSLCASSAGAQLYPAGPAQGPPDRDAFARAALDRIARAAAQAETDGQQRLQASRVAMASTQEALRATRARRPDAEARVAQLAGAEESIRKRLARDSNMVQWNGQRLLRAELQQARDRRMAAERELRTLVAQEQELAARLASLEGGAQGTAATLEETRSRFVSERQQVAQLESAWRSTGSDQAWHRFTEQVTASARALGVTSRVTWKTSPRTGARIFFQTLDEASRRAEPWSVSNLTETSQSIPIGYYLVWAQRGGMNTSNRNQQYRIVDEEEVVTIQENIFHD